MSLFGELLSVVGIAASVYYASQGYTDGLLLVIVILLVGILMVLATRAR